MDEKWLQYKTIVGYGVGQYYESIKEELFQAVKLDYLCDRKLDDEQVKEYDGFNTITREELAKCEDVLVIVMVGVVWIYEAIRREMESCGAAVVHVDEIINKQINWNGKALKSNYPGGRYEDTRGNIICFDETLPDKLIIALVGYNNRVTIGSNLAIGYGNVYIRMGNNGVCHIGKNSDIIGASFFVSEAQLSIGTDCLLSSEIIIRTHDQHHIFDRNTHKRINYAKDIFIEDNVWIAQRVMLLGGTKIGTGSVVGAGAITSSQFGDHQIIAGVPARCIRENICWSKDDIDYFDRACLEECRWQESLRYL